MVDVAKINPALGIKRTGGVFGTANPVPVFDDRTYETATANQAGAQNAGGNATPAPSFGVIVGSGLEGYGSRTNPVQLKLDPDGGLAFTDEGLAASGVSSNDYFIGEVDNGNSGAAKTISFVDKSNQKLTLTANTTLTFTPPSTARKTLIRFVQGGSGAYTVTLPSGVSGGLPTIASGVGSSTAVNFYYDGATWHV